MALTKVHLKSRLGFSHVEGIGEEEKHSNGCILLYIFQVNFNNMARKKPHKVKPLGLGSLMHVGLGKILIL